MSIFPMQSNHCTIIGVPFIEPYQQAIAILLVFTSKLKFIYNRKSPLVSELCIKTVVLF